MIKRIRLVNFQRHKFLDIEFSPLVTSLVGATEAGKSAVIRALALVCLNKWSSSYVRHGKDRCKVILDVGGKQLCRIKGKGVNVYKIGKKQFKAFATSIPEEVQDLLKMDEDNFQLQLDPHFWFTDTPGVVSKKLNRIVNLQVIDDAMYRAASASRKAKANVEFVQTRLMVARNKAKELKWAVRMSQDMKAVLEAGDRLEGFAIKSRQLADRIKSVSGLTRTIQMLTDAILSLKKPVEAGRRVAALTKKAVRLKRLLKETAEYEKFGNLPDLDFSAVKKAREHGDKVSYAVGDLELMLEDLVKLEKESKQWDSEIESLSKKVKEAGRKCPTCGSLIPSKKKGSQSSSPTYTSGTRPRCHEPRKTLSGTT